jgi:ABC-type branched-subunit amino acid transport system ATPase component
MQLGAFASRARARERERLREVSDLFPRLAERRQRAARSMSGDE